MKVYTYYEQAEELNDFSPLIELWKEKWLGEGHEPIVINSSYCKPSRALYALSAHISTLPTINPRQYTLNNFLRWLAMHHITSTEDTGALHVDSDVFPNKFVFPDFDTSKVTVWQKDLCPCGFWIPASGCADVLTQMFSYNKGILINGREHCCDQEFVRWLYSKEPTRAYIDAIKSYLTEPDWASGGLIHYPTANLPYGNKAKILRELLCH